MAKINQPYQLVVVESFIPEKASGLHGAVHIRPLSGQGMDGLHVECSKSLTRDYAIGTRFRIRAKLTDREGSGDFLYSFHGWPVEVLTF